MIVKKLIIGNLILMPYPNGGVCCQVCGDDHFIYECPEMDQKEKNIAKISLTDMITCPLCERPIESVEFVVCLNCGWEAEDG